MHATDTSVLRACKLVTNKYNYYAYLAYFGVGMTGGCKGRELLLPVMGETAPQLGRGREHGAGRGQKEPPSAAPMGKAVNTRGLRQIR